MKKIILLVLMAAMLATPCFAQEVEPKGLFSIEGTLWGFCAIGLFSIPPFVGMSCAEQIGFYQGKLYACLDNVCTYSTSDISSYNDLIVVSLASDIGLPQEKGWSILLAIMQPTIRLGTIMGIAYISGERWVPRMLAWQIGIMFKINDNWTPPGVE